MKRTPLAGPTPPPTSISHPSRCRRWWHRAHRRTPLLRLVGPASRSHQRIWWASHQDGGALHQAHPPSRSTSARRCAGVNSRRARPQSRTSDVPPSTAGTTSASAAAWRNASALTGWGAPSMLADAEPGLEFRARHTHHDRGLHPAGGGRAVEGVPAQVGEEVRTHLPRGARVGFGVVAPLAHREPHAGVQHGAHGRRRERREPCREGDHAVGVVAQRRGAGLVLAFLAFLPGVRVRERLRLPHELADLVQGESWGLGQSLREQKARFL